MIEGKPYIIGGSGEIHAGEMSGTPGHNTVHNGQYVSTSPSTKP